MANIVINRNVTADIVAIIPSDDDTSSGIPTLVLGGVPSSVGCIVLNVPPPIDVDTTVPSSVGCKVLNVPPTSDVDTTVGTGDVSSVVVVVDVVPSIGRRRHSPSSPIPFSRAPKSQ
jgi:hypothetical protein